MDKPQDKEWCSHCVRWKDKRLMARTGLCQMCAKINVSMAKALADKLNRETGGKR